jgi:hypothetical protein
VHFIATIKVCYWLLAAKSASGHKKRHFALQSASPLCPQKRTSAVQAKSRRDRPANNVSSYPFFAGREGKSPSVPIWSEVDSLTRIHIPNKDKHKVPIAFASSVQTHCKPSVRFLQTDLCFVCFLCLHMNCLEVLEMLCHPQDRIYRQNDLILRKSL